jgi:hypothetical protein
VAALAFLVITFGNGDGIAGFGQAGLHPSSLPRLRGQ